MSHRVSFLFLLLVIGCPKPDFAQRPCEDLTKLRLTNVTITATALAAGAFKPPSDPYEPPPRTALPAFCRVQGIARPTGDSEIKFELWLPASSWNGKFEQVGNGGLAGTIPLPSMVEPLLRGYAIAATDDGHAGSPVDGAWAIGHPEKVIDFGYRAVHETSVQAKAILREFYGKDPAQSYFMGCSDGGREALMEAQRFPADFRGIIAGAPANYWTHLMFREAWNERAVTDNPAGYIPAGKLVVLQNAVLAQCDAIDGVKDGLIQNPRACRFDPAVVQCKGADSAAADSGCLTAAQVEAARKIYGPVTASHTGARISPGYSPGTEGVPANWEVWMMGPKAGAVGLGALIGDSFFSGMVFENAKWDVQKLNFSSDVKLTDEKLAAVLNSTDPNLVAFRKLGGKLIQYHGWGDAAIPPQDSIDYFQSVQSAMGKTSDFYRLFMVPGMSHCGGGLGANVFGNQLVVPDPDAAHDLVIALDQWVVHDVAPDQFIATAFVDGNPAKEVVLTRPLCPYPQEARYKGAGKTNTAASFTCKAPPSSASK